jgi:hypothetical protein
MFRVADVKLICLSAFRPGCAAQPWRCLWRGFSQITMTRPWRRITLHLSQIFFTLGLTFIEILSLGSERVKVRVYL